MSFPENKAEYNTDDVPDKVKETLGEEGALLFPQGKALAFHLNNLGIEGLHITIDHSKGEALVSVVPHVEGSKLDDPKPAFGMVVDLLYAFKPDPAVVESGEVNLG